MTGLTDKRYSCKDPDFKISWPTGFSGVGWSAVDSDGNVVFRAAFRVEVLNFIAAQ